MHEPIFQHEKIMLDVATKHGLTVKELKAKGQRHIHTKARREAYYELYKDGTRSLPQIARMFSGRHHTTILLGIREHVKGMGK